MPKSFLTLGILESTVEIMRILRKGETACLLEEDHARLVFDTARRLCERLRALEQERRLPAHAQAVEHIRR